MQFISMIRTFSVIHILKSSPNFHAYHMPNGIWLSERESGKTYARGALHVIHIEIFYLSSVGKKKSCLN